MTTIDPSIFAAQEETAQDIPSDSELATIASLAEEQVLLEDEITNLNEIINKKVGKFREIAEVKLPEAMRDVGLTSITLESGKTVTLKDNIYASISKARQEEAFKWLRDNGHGSLIKERVVNESVHSGTLKAFVREQLQAGKPLPLKLFGVHEVTVAVIK